MITREPVAWIGFIIAVIYLILQSALDGGIITSDQTKTLVKFLVVVIIGIGTLIQRSLVTPTAAPVLPIGKPVTSPESAQPNNARVQG